MIELSHHWKRAGWPELLLLCIIAGALYHSLAHSIVVDDAFISYRYAENFAEGQGLVFNVGERVEGYTNFLWVVILAACHRLGLSTVGMSVPLGIAAYLLTLLVVYMGGRSMGMSKWISLIAPLVLASSASATRWASAGMETPFYGLLITSAVIRLVVECRNQSLRPMSGLLFGLAALTRPEGAGVFAVGILFAAYPCRLRVRWLTMVTGSFVAIVISHLVFRINYYGYPLPNTYYAKVFPGADSWRDGWDYLSIFGVSNILPVALLLPGLAVLRRGLVFPMAVIAGCLSCVAVYIAYVGGDFYDHWRFVAPYIGLVGVCAAILIDGCHTLLTKMGGAWTSAPSLTVGVLLALVMFMCTWMLVANDRAGQSWSDWHRQWKKVSDLHERYGDWFRIRYPKDTLAAVTWLGRLPYYSGMRTLDMLGIADEHIAHHGLYVHADKPGHRRRDPDYVLRRSPQLVLIEIDPVKLGEALLHESLTTDRLFEAIMKHARIRALPALVQKRNFRLQYAPRLEQIGEDEYIAFFERDDTLLHMIESASEHATDPKFFFDLSLRYRKHGLAANAIDALRRVVALDPGSVAAQMNLAYLLFDIEMLSAAIREFRQILSIHPGHLDSRYGLALTLHRMKDYRSSAVEWRRYLNSGPDSRYSANARAFLKEAELALSKTQGK